MATKSSVDQLNSFLRGELSAVEAYRIAVEKFDAVSPTRRLIVLILGVVAIGLAEDEDLLINGAEDETDDGPVPGTARARPFDNYARIAELQQPCAVIQATHDNYFPAASARRRFGSDTPHRRFYAIEATNHRFSHGTARFYEALRDSLHWIASGNPAASAGG